MSGIDWLLGGPEFFPGGSVDLPAVKTKFRYKVNPQRFLREEKVPAI